MSTDMIRFDVLVQEALRGVVRKVLVEVARTGLPGEHHFYVTFDTCHPGVRVSSRVKARYPEEMTIVLQHQFWDLNVGETGFDVGLSFGGIPEKLVIPFAAVKGFFDPSVQFGLQFEVAKDEAANDGDAVDGAGADGGAKIGPARLASVKDESTPDGATPGTPARLLPAIATASLPVGKAAPADADDDDGDAGVDDDDAAAAPPTATIVSLDQFRKKT